MMGLIAGDLPPGFRFHPTDEELIVYYLRNQATSKPCPVSIIREVDIYKFDPWQLPDQSEVRESEWYFFSPRDRKYPNGVRPNRATTSGYWKATGTDKAIYSGSNFVGVKKALVFYTGRPPKGVKTEWIMHEYRLSEPKSHASSQNSMRLDDWVLCRIYKKKHSGRSLDKIEEKATKTELDLNSGSNCGDQEQMMKIPWTCSFSHLLPWPFIGEDAYGQNYDSQYVVDNIEFGKSVMAEYSPQQLVDSGAESLMYGIQ